MADKKVTAQLELDASGVKKGAEEAEESIKKVKDAADDLGNTDTDKLKDNLDDVGGSADKAKPKIDNLKSALDSITKVGQTLTKTLTLPLVGFGALAVKEAGSFEFAMAEVSAASGIVGDDLKALEQQARDLGKSTFFSAQEAAEGMTNYARAGYDANEIMSVMPGTLDLAVASNTDLATTCGIVSSAMKGLGMEVEETTRFTDILAKASSESNTTVKDLGEAFKYCAPVAGSLKIKAEDLAVALGTMANASISGSMAGTQIRAVLSRMVKPTKEVQQAMDKYNIALKTNEDGSVDLMGTMELLRKNLGDLEEVERANVLATIAGQEAMSGLASIVSATEDDFNSLKNEIYNCDGATKEMSDTMGNTFQGKLKTLNSAFGELKIAIGKVLIPTLEKFVEKLTECFNWFNNLDEGTQKMIVGIAGVVAAIGPALLIFGTLGKTILNVSGVIKGLASGMGLTVTASSLLTAGLVALGVGFAGALAYMGSSNEMISTLQTNFGKFGTFISYLGEFLYGVFQLTFGNIGILLKTLGQMLMALMKGDFKEVGSIWKDGWAEMEANTAKAGSNIAMQTARATQKMREMSSNELDALQNNFDATMNNLKQVTADNIDETAKLFVDQLKTMDNESIELLKGTSDTMAMLFDGIGANMTEKQAMNVFTGNLESMVRSGELSLESLEASTKEFNKMLELNMSTGATQMESAGKKLFENFKNEATRGINETADLVVADLQKMDADTFAVLQGCGDTWGQVFADISLDGSMSTEEMKNKIVDNFTAMGMSGSEVMNQLKTELSNATASMKETTSANMDALPPEVADAVNGMITEASNATAIKDSIDFGTAGTGDVVASNMSGTADAVNSEVSGAINNASNASQIKDNLDAGTSGASQVVDKNLSNMASSVNKNTSNLAQTADTNFQKMKTSADTNTKAMATSAKTNATDMYNGAKTSFTSMTNSATSSTATMKNNVINNLATMKNSAIRFWQEIRAEYSKAITGEIKITKAITEKTTKVVTVETEGSGKPSMATLLTRDDSINLTEKNSALRSLAIISSTDRIKAEEDTKKEDNKPSNRSEVKNITYNYSYTSPVESSISELRRKDRIQAQRIALSR